MRVEIVVNPTAGRGRGLQVAEGLAERFAALGFEPRLQSTEGPGHATRLVEDALDSVQRVVVVGGDGTLRECAQGLGERAADLPLAFVPLGNANVVARELGIPLDPALAAECALHGHPRPLDTMRANGRFALAMVGVGFDGRVTRRVAAARRGRLAGWYKRHADSLYGAIGAAALLERSVPLRIEVDGARAPRHYADAVVSNFETYAKGWAVTPGADPSDGLLDWVGRPEGGALRLLGAMRAARRRRRLPPALADYGRGRTVRIRSDQPLCWQVDGDPMEPVDEILVEIGPPIRVLTPADA